MPSLREQRIALNEAMFRVVNERLACWPEKRNVREGVRVEFYCECGDRACFERVKLTNPEYAALRADPTRFAVVPGHVFPDVERVVQERAGYVVVEKNEGTQQIVERMTRAQGED
jgi:hypothetical protein